MKLSRIISGGQTGADQGGVNAAMKAGVPWGGSIPKGRRSENGPIPARYTEFKEHDKDTYPPRTWKNVHDSDGTAVFTIGPAERGSKLTIDFCKKQGRYWLHVDLSKKDQLQAAGMLRAWATRNKIKVLNVAGNRESHSPGIGRQVENVLLHALLPRKGNPQVALPVRREKENV
jgi:hypothetical protein